ncbi:MAG: peptidoglycan DD-metalloendopeptidase family protein [Flavobacteriales bacterium]
MRLPLIVFTLLLNGYISGQNSFYGGGFEESMSEKNFHEKSLFLNIDDVFSATENPNREDSMELIPSFDIYENWDTKNIHAYNEDLSKMEGAVKLSLVKSNHDYCHPIKGVVTSDFGYRSGKYHYGIDLRVKIGDPIYSAFDGVVRISQYSSSYGNVMVVRHENGLETLYAHLSKRLHKAGQRVKAGQKLGLGGNTGRSTGPHLHFECRYLGEPINPNDIIDFEEGVLKGKDLALTKESFSYLMKMRKKKYHPVSKGETLYSISRRYKVSVTNLCKMNGISQKSPLRVGQRLRVR